MPPTPAGARRRYVISGVLVVIAVALGATFGVIVTRAIAGYDIAPLSDPTGASGSSVTVGERSLAIWVSPDLGTATCGSVDDATGRDSFSSGSSVSMSFTKGSRSWVRVGTVQGRPGSTHTVTCEVEPGVVVGQADTPRVARYLVLGAALGGTALLLVLAAFTLALVTALRRRAAPGA